MSTDILSTYVTAEEYLERERASTGYKSEWIDGEVREMTGAKRAHGTITTNIIALLAVQLRGRPLDTNPGHMKIRIPDGGPYYYPDVCVFPDPPTFEDGHEDVVLDPVVVVEVLSPSTQRMDRGRKLADYRSLPSLREYLLVDQFEARVEHHVLDGGAWSVRIEAGLATSVSLPSIDCSLPLADVYDRILPVREE